MEIDPCTIEQLGVALRAVVRAHEVVNLDDYMGMPQVV